MDPEIASLMAMRGLDGLTPGQWLEIQDLMLNRFGEKAGTDVLELNKLVKNFLAAQPNFMPAEAGKFMHSIHLLPSFKNLPPEMATWLGKTEGTEKLVPKLEQNPSVPVDKEPSPKEADRPKLHTTIEQKVKEALAKKESHTPSQPVEQAIKEVVKALSYFIPRQMPDEMKKEAPRTEAHAEKMVTAPKESSSAEFTSKNPETPPLPKPEPKAQPKHDIHPELSTMKSERPMPNRTIEQQKPAEQPIDRPAVAPTTPKPVTLPTFNLPTGERKAEEAPKSHVSSTSVSAQSTQRPAIAETTVITAAPYSAQNQLNDIRRKVKKKRAEYPWYGEEEEEENPEQKK